MTVGAICGKNNLKYDACLGGGLIASSDMGMQHCNTLVTGLPPAYVLFESEYINFTGNLTINEKNMNQFFTDKYGEKHKFFIGSGTAYIQYKSSLRFQNPKFLLKFTSECVVINIVKS